MLGEVAKHLCVPTVRWGHRPPASQLHCANICLALYTSLKPLFMMLVLTPGVECLHFEGPTRLARQVAWAVPSLSLDILRIGSWHSRDAPTPTPFCIFWTTGQHVVQTGRATCLPPPPTLGKCLLCSEPVSSCQLPGLPQGSAGTQEVLSTC